MRKYRRESLETRQKRRNERIMKTFKMKDLDIRYRFGGTSSGTPGVEIATHKGAFKNRTKMV
ncbi:hypothetical protein [Filifactor villosus]|uniref:Uncharacterized protein n=1 Tax=Filifactor villosus TaxID=29374 RepID=A0ABV9QJ54_9FIRM